MTLVVREFETPERAEARVLGALRCVDASTRAVVAGPLQAHIAGARLRRNRSGLLVIVQADALAEHEAAFLAPPAAPGLGSVPLTVALDDPAGRYLPRLARLALPRDPDPEHADREDSLFRPIEIAMYPASRAPLGANWAVLRVTAHALAGGDALGGALLIVRSGTGVLARGLSDWRGEALVPVPGVPVTTWSDDPDDVVVSEVAVQLELVFDPARGTRVAASDVRAGRAPAVLPQVDPDMLEDERLTLPNAALALRLAAGRSETVPFPLALP